MEIAEAVPNPEFAAVFPFGEFNDMQREVVGALSGTGEVGESGTDDGGGISGMHPGLSEADAVAESPAGVAGNTMP